MLHRYRQVIVCGIALSVAASLPASGVVAAESIVGYVVDYQGAAKAFEIRRGSQAVSVAPTQALDAGDKVTIVQPADEKGKPNTITLNVAGESVIVDAQNSPFCVGSQGGKCGAPPQAVTPAITAMLAGLQNLLSTIVAPALRQAKYQYDVAKSQPLRSRGPGTPPSMPILLATPAYEPANLAMLVIPISGGNPPLQVALFSGSGTEPIAQQRNLNETETRLAIANLPAGTYRLQVNDASNASASENFVAVATTEVPPPPESSLSVAMNASQAFIRDLAVTGYATFLQSKGPQWYLTAYQELQKTSPDFAPAHDLLFRLREGP